MDFESLRNQVSNLTLYDIKAGVRKVQNGTGLHNYNAVHPLTSVNSGDELYRDGGEG